MPQGSSAVRPTNGLYLYLLVNVKRVFWFSVQLLFEIFLILSIQRDFIINVYRSSCEVSVNLVRLWSKLNFLDKCSKSQVSNFMKIRPVRAELFHADRQTDGRTDITKVIVPFRSFANAPKILRSARTVFLRILCGSEHKQRLFPSTTLTDWFL